MSKKKTDVVSGKYHCSKCGQRYDNSALADECSLQGKIISHLKEVWRPGKLLVFDKKIWPVIKLSIAKRKPCIGYRVFFTHTDNYDQGELTVTHYNPDRWLAAGSVSIKEAVNNGWRVSSSVRWEEMAAESMQEEYREAILGIISSMTQEKKNLMLLEHMLFCRKK